MGFNEVGRSRRQSTTRIHANVCGGWRIGENPDPRRLVKEGGRRGGDAPLPGSLERPQDGLAPPPGHHDATTRVIPSLDAGNQERIRPHQCLDAHGAARYVLLALASAPQRGRRGAGSGIAGRQAER